MTERPTTTGTGYLGLWCPLGRGLRHKTPPVATLAGPSSAAYRCPCNAWHTTMAWRVPDDATDTRTRAATP